jgi:hypothetical protein
MPALTRVCTAGFFVHVGKARSPKRIAEIDEQIDNKLTSQAWHIRIIITIKKKNSNNNITTYYQAGVRALRTLCSLVVARECTEVTRRSTTKKCGSGAVSECAMT